MGTNCPTCSKPLARSIIMGVDGYCLTEGCEAVALTPRPQTLQSYLSSGAVEDVRALLDALAAKNGHPYVEICVGSASIYSLFARPRDAWTEIECRPYLGEPTGWSVYYREQSVSYIVSDCGETVSEVMRRTGKTPKDSAKFARSPLFGEQFSFVSGQGDANGIMVRLWEFDISAESADLPAAIVSVLGAIAKVRSALDKDGGQ